MNLEVAKSHKTEVVRAHCLLRHQAVVRMGMKGKVLYLNRQDAIIIGDISSLWTAVCVGAAPWLLGRQPFLFSP